MVVSLDSAERGKNLRARLSWLRWGIHYLNAILGTRSCTFWCNMKLCLCVYKFNLRFWILVVSLSASEMYCWFAGSNMGIRIKTIFGLRNSYQRFLILSWSGWLKNGIRGSLIKAQTALSLYLTLVILSYIQFLFFLSLSIYHYSCIQHFLTNLQRIDTKSIIELKTEYKHC